MLQEGRMVVLANSMKCGGYCLAGRTIRRDGSVGAWVRPVTEAAEAGLPRSRVICSDGAALSVLDVVAGTFGDSTPVMHQRENRLLGRGAFERCGRLDWHAVSLLAEHPAGALWVDGYSSSSGLNDRVPAASLADLDGSLKLIAVENLELYVTLGFNGQTKRRASFCYGGQRYNLAMTDAVAAVGLSSDLRQKWDEALLCISLAFPFHDGYAYKLASSIITPERAGGHA